MHGQMEMRGFKTTIALALCFCVSAFADEQGFGKGLAEVRAEKLEVDHSKKSAQFEGKVRATYGELVVNCDRMQLTYNAKGEVVSLKAEGKVVVTRGDAKATATLATLDAKQGVLILKGNPVLVRGENRLEGERITIHLKDNRIDIFDARGTFKLGAGTGT